VARSHLPAGGGLFENCCATTTRQLASDLGRALRRKGIAFTQKPVNSAEAVQLCRQKSGDSASCGGIAGIHEYPKTHNGPQALQPEQDQGRITLTMTIAHRQAVLTSDAVDRSRKVVRRRLNVLAEKQAWWNTAA